MKKPAAHDHASAAVFLMRAKGFMQRKQIDAALADLAEALRLNPRLGDALMVRVAALVEKGEYREALADVERRLELPPPDSLALLTRGNLRAHLDELEAALRDFTEYLRQFPGTAVALRACALTYSRLRRFDGALADLDEAVRVEPTSAEIYEERGRVQQDKGCYTAAAADYEKAVALGPNDAGCHNQYAWMLAACPQAEYRNGACAVELARRGCELTSWQEANLLDTLASAYAECGQFDEAVRWASKALESASDEIKETIREHVELFLRGPARPFCRSKLRGANTTQFALTFPAPTVSCRIQSK